jgi:hypothetical protein
VLTEDNSYHSDLKEHWIYNLRKIKSVYEPWESGNEKVSEVLPFVLTSSLPVERVFFVV